MKKLKILISLLVAILFSFNQSIIAKDFSTNNEAYIIGDFRGDWGLPTPYTVIPRGPGFERMYLAFDTLIWKDKEGRLIPALAKEWSYEEDTNIYTFKIDPLARWHDGNKVTSTDIKFTINYIKKHPLEYIEDLSNIKDIIIVDDQTISFKLKDKISYFYSNIAASIPILPSHIYKNIKNPKSQVLSSMKIGSGPYKIHSYNQEKGEYVFKSNHNYYQGAPYINVIKFYKINPQFQSIALTTGKVDSMYITEKIRGLKKANDNLSIKTGLGIITRLGFNHNLEPYSNPKFRKAIAYLIDKDELINIGLKGEGTFVSAGGFVKGSYYFNKDIEEYLYNKEKADLLLKEVGYEFKDNRYVKDNKPLTLNILINQGSTKTAEVIKEQLKRSGIDTAIEIKDGGSVDQMLLDWNFQLTIKQEGAMGDPIYLNRLVLANASTSDRYYKSQEMITILDKQKSQIDNIKRRDSLLEFQDIYSKELPSYNLYYTNDIYVNNNIIDMYFTKGGIGAGIPSALNKMVFIENPNN